MSNNKVIKENLSEHYRHANCVSLSEVNGLGQRQELDGVLKTPEIIIDGKSYYRKTELYCSLTKLPKKNFEEICPNSHCLYKDGKSHTIKEIVEKPKLIMGNSNSYHYLNYVPNRKLFLPEKDKHL